MSDVTDVKAEPKPVLDQTSDKIFLLQNQDKLLLSKQGTWTDGRDLGVLYKTRHKDEAVNQMFEASSKDYTQRLHIIDCPIGHKGMPEIADELLPPPLPKPPKVKSEAAPAEADENTVHADETESVNSDTSIDSAVDETAENTAEEPVETSSKDSPEADGNQSPELTVNRH